ncbi:MAG: ATP-binding protein [Chloroherpetonaceae bacterium]|nr:ATP-binding protein [Chloroherpetonaceae bacterium]
MPEGTPFVELPVNVTEDRLLGGLDLEAALATGKRVIERGLLAKANGGVLYVDALNLLDNTTAAYLIETMSRGVVFLEREGLSAVHEAKFMLIATFDPSDGNARMGLLDRIGLIVPFSAQTQAETRAEVIRRVRAHEVKGAHQQAEIEEEENALRALILAARADLKDVVLYDEQIEALAQAAVELGIEGNRVDVFATKAAAASAALRGCREVDDDDLKLATKLVLAPRATRLPEEQAEQKAPETVMQEPPQPAQSHDNTESNEQTDTNEMPSPEEIREMLLETVETELPDVLQHFALMQQRKGKSGKRSVAENMRRGKYVRAVSGHLREGKLALIPTMLAAAPWQRVRHREDQRKSFIIKKDDIRVKRFSR